MIDSIFDSFFASQMHSFCWIHYQFAKRESRDPPGQHKGETIHSFTVMSHNSFHDQRAFTSRKKHTKASPTTSSVHSKRRTVLFSMLCCSLFKNGRGVAAFTRQTSSASTRKNHALALSSPSSDNAVKQRGLILPSHPEFPITSVMAPMVAASDYPFRHFLRKQGVDLTFTQMLHCKNFLNDPNFRKSHLDFWEAGVEYKEMVPAQTHCLGTLLPPKGQVENVPLIVQLAGNEPGEAVQVAQSILEHTNGKVAGIDLNCGCPQNIAKKGNYGAFLMERDVDRVCQILRELRNNLPESTAVSAKIRLPLDDTLLQQRISKLVDTGINFLTIHGRTVLENKTKGGACHVDRIRLAVETAHTIDPNFQIIANGGMENYQDVQDMLEVTGAVAAMSSEALLETPNIFSKDSSQLSPRELLVQQLSFAKDYLNVCATVMPPLPGVLGLRKGGSINVIRGHLFKFLHRYLNEQTDLRDRLAGVKYMHTIQDAQELVDDLEQRYDNVSDEELSGRYSSSPGASWYRRHRKPERRVHQKEIRVDSSLLTVPETEEESVEQKKEQIRERIRKMKGKKNSNAIV